MGHPRTSVASDSALRVRFRPSTRSRVAACGAAGILAVSLVAVPPDFESARSDVVAVRIAHVALPSALLPPGLGQQFVDRLDGGLARAVASVVPAAVADVPSGTTSLTLAADPGVGDTQANAVAPAGLDLNALLGPLLPIIGPIVLFAPLAAIVTLAFPLLLPGAIGFYVDMIALYIDEWLNPIPVAALSTSAPANDQLLKGIPPDNAATSAPVDEEPATVAPTDGRDLTSRVVATGGPDASVGTTAPAIDVTEPALVENLPVEKPSGEIPPVEKTPVDEQPSATPTVTRRPSLLDVKPVQRLTDAWRRTMNSGSTRQTLAPPGKVASLQDTVSSPVGDDADGGDSSDVGDGPSGAE